MHIAVGIDLVEVGRFANWHTYSDKFLARVFSPEEIAYCRSTPALSAERFAARFAAKEACYKALSQRGLLDQIPLLAFLPRVSVKTSSHGPTLTFRLTDTGLTYPFARFVTLLDTVSCSLSLSHTATTACAVVIVTHQPVSA